MAENASPTKHAWRPSTRNRQPVLTCANAPCLIVWWPDRREPKSKCAGTPQSETAARVRAGHDDRGWTVTADRHLADWLNKARLVRSLPAGEPWPAWSTGEILAVAVIVGDDAMLTAAGYTLVEALERLRHEIGEPTAGAALDVFLRLRGRLEES